MRYQKNWRERSRRRGWGKLLSLLAVLFAVTVASTSYAQPRDDMIIALDPDSFVDLRFEDEPAPVGLQNGAVLIQSEDAYCQPSPANPCHHVITQVRFQLSDFDLGDFDVDDSVVVIKGPIPVTDIGSGVVIPTGTSVFSGAVIDGPGIDPGFRGTDTALPSDIVLIFDVDDQELSMTGQFSVTFDLDGDSLTGVGQIIASGEIPWINRPPVADAGEDQMTVCLEEVELDASASFDFDGNIANYVWTEGGTTIGNGSIVTTSLDVGVHEITLEVFDTYGSRGQDSVEVLVEDESPTFTFLPSDITTSFCAGLDIGEATAVSCGLPAVVENDAPESFHVGTTVVTWTATSASGTQATAEQVVVVELGDDPACCPLYANVIVGTPDDDVLDGSAGADCVVGLGGSDRINTFAGDDIVSGGAGSDTIATHSGNDIVFGGDGSDTIDAGDQDDFVDGGGEADVCSGGSGTNGLRSCEVGAFCTAACCAMNACIVPGPVDGSDCGPAFHSSECLTYSLGTTVSVAGHNWECIHGNCANCATHVSCEPGASGCPWGNVWNDRGECE